MQKCREKVFEFCKKAAENGYEALERADPELVKKLHEIAWKYKEMKRIQHEEGDAPGIPCPFPDTTGIEVQYLHKIFPDTNRFSCAVTRIAVMRAAFLVSTRIGRPLLQKEAGNLPAHIARIRTV